MIIETGGLSGAILTIIGSATATAMALTHSGFSGRPAFVHGTSARRPSDVHAVSIVAFVVLGSVLEGISAIMRFGPPLLPIARAMGINEVQYAVVVILSMGLGLFSPPFGVGYCSACAVSKVHPDAGMHPISGYMVVLLIGIVIIASVSWISTGFLTEVRAYHRRIQ
jgi:TRAP-type C4-dicarboxylate transport system permease large subunit